MPPAVWQGVRRVLAVRLDNIGDVLMTGPALRALRHALPDATIVLLASPAGSQAARLLPWIDDVLVERVSWQDASGSLPLDPQRELDLVGRLREGAFDAAVIFTSFSQSPDVPAYACYLAGIPIRLGQTALFSGSVLSQRVIPPAPDAHQVDRNLHLVEQAGFATVDRGLEVSIPAGEDAAASALLAEAGIDPDRPFAVIAPGASCPARRYDPNRFAQVARRLGAAAELPIVVVGSERERELASSIVTLAASADGGTAVDGVNVDSGASPVVRPPRREAFLPLPAEPVVSLAGRTSIPGLAAVIRRARILVANDSGPMHMADAVGTPMVILFSGTELERQWRPRRAPAVLLRRRTSCSPCYRFECPYQMECLDIEPAEVVREALRLLATEAHALARHVGHSREALDDPDAVLGASALAAFASPRTLPAPSGPLPARGRPHGSSGLVQPGRLTSSVAGGVIPAARSPVPSPLSTSVLSAAGPVVPASGPGPVVSEITVASGKPLASGKPASGKQEPFATHRSMTLSARSASTAGLARAPRPPAAHPRRKEPDAIPANPDVARPRELPVLPRPRRP